MSSNVLGGAIPVFRVESVAASIDHYVNVFGFKINWKTQGFASVARDKCIIFLCEGDQGHFGTWIWAGVNDAVAFETELKGKGAKIRHPPTNYPWALEMQVEDLDGNILRFGSDPIKGRPYGEWLDMNGRLWSLVQPEKP